MLIFKPVTFEELWAQVGAGMNFTAEEVMMQMDAAERNGHGLQVIHRDFGFEITLENIREFFVSHPRPVRNVTIEEENLELKKRIQELEHSLKDAGISAKKVVRPPSSPAFEVPVQDLEGIDNTEVLPITDNRDFIPSPEQREKERQTPEQIQRELAEDLKSSNAPKDFRKITPTQKQRPPIEVV